MRHAVRQNSEQPLCWQIVSCVGKLNALQHGFVEFFAVESFRKILYQRWCLKANCNVCSYCSTNKFFTVFLWILKTVQYSTHFNVLLCIVPLFVDSFLLMLIYESISELIIWVIAKANFYTLLNNVLFFYLIEITLKKIVVLFVVRLR